MRAEYYALPELHARRESIAQRIRAGLAELEILRDEINRDRMRETRRGRTLMQVVTLQPPGYPLKYWAIGAKRFGFMASQPVGPELLVYPMLRGIESGVLISTETIYTPEGLRVVLPPIAVGDLFYARRVSATLYGVPPERLRIWVTCETYYYRGCYQPQA